MVLLLYLIAMQFLFIVIADFIRDIVLPMVDQKAS
jgi:hypothetical protein